MHDPDDIDDADDFRAALHALLDAAEAADVPHDSVAGLLTVYLAGLRGDVRLPLGMDPDRAREFLAEAEDHVGGTMEVELRVSREVLDDIDLQLEAFADEDGEG